MTRQATQTTEEKLEVMEIEESHGLGSKIRTSV